jgi:hypothetical protein
VEVGGTGEAYDEDHGEYLPCEGREMRGRVGRALELG